MHMTFTLPFRGGNVVVRHDFSMEDDDEVVEGEIRRMINIIDGTCKHEAE